MTNALIIILDLWADREFQKLEMSAARTIAQELDNLDEEWEFLETRLKFVKAEKAKINRSIREEKWYDLYGILDNETIEIFCNFSPTGVDFGIEIEDFRRCL